MRPSAARDLLECGTRKADARLDPDFNAAQHSPMLRKVSAETDVLKLKVLSGEKAGQPRWRLAVSGQSKA